MAEGPERGLELMDELAGGRSTATTSSTPPGPTCCAGSAAPTRRAAAYRRARELTANPAERAFLERRLGETASA